MTGEKALAFLLFSLAYTSLSKEAETFEKFTSFKWLTRQALLTMLHDIDTVLFISHTEGISFCQHHQSTEFMDIQFNYTYTAGDLATLYCRIKDLGTKVVSTTTTTTTTTTNTTIPKNNNNNNNNNNYSIIIPKTSATTIQKHTATLH